MQLFIRTPTKYYFVSIFIIVTALFCTFSVVIYRHYIEARRINEWALYNYEVNRQSRKILMDLVDMETGMRGYLLTGKEKFLEPYLSSQKTLVAQIQRLRDYAKADPAVQSNLGSWLKKIETFSALLDQQLQNFRMKGRSAISLSLLDRQKREMDGLRGLLEGFINLRLDDLQKQLAQSNNAQNDFKYILAIGTVLAVSGMFLVTWLFLALSRRSLQAEEAARTIEDRFQTVLNGVNDGLYDYDLKNDTIYFSPTYKAMLGYSNEEFPNTIEMSRSLVHPDDHPQSMEIFNRYIRGEISSYSNVFRMRHKDGSWVWILSRGVGLADRDDRITRLIGTHSDITDQKRREEELSQLNSEMETFTYITSHDLRAPLVNLKGFASEMEQAINKVKLILGRRKEMFTPEEQTELTEAFNDDISESLRFIVQSVQRMDSLTTAVLDLSRIGKREYQFKPVHVQAVVQRCLDTLAYEISQKNIEVVCDEMPSIITDPLALEQIFSNLLDNAVKYLDPNRKMKITITSKSIGSDVIFSIEDTGRGIAAIDRDKVFQIFRRARNATDVRGMGMGMTYVQATLRRLGGTIWFESQPSVGTTFFFSLPKNIRPR